MQNVFNNPVEIEKNAKERFQIPDFLMMENAAIFLRDFILKTSDENKITKPSVSIYCGKGNNGADGYALARLLKNKADIKIYSIHEPKSLEAKKQYDFCKELNLLDLPEINKPDFIIDCIFGSGFHGQMDTESQKIISEINKKNAIKIACDIPSGLNSDCTFRADYTVSMGTQKLSFYTDSAKDYCGKIIVADLGFPRSDFENNTKPDAFLIEEDDIILPLRKQPSVHKGKFGHTVIFAGDKSGASILAATACMNFGSGLTSILKPTNPSSDFSSFKISPEIMLADKIPAKTTCLVLGPGIVCHNLSDNQMILDYFNDNSKKNKAAVFDAGVFDQKAFVQEIINFSNQENTRIVLTPHLSELNRFCNLLKELIPQIDFSEDDFNVSSLANNLEAKIKIGKEINKYLPNASLVIKSANTFIAVNQEIFIINDGCQNLAKGGSGDVLAGMTGALLSQGYDIKNASITACEVHALASAKFDKCAFDITPFKLISKI